MDKPIITIFSKEHYEQGAHIQVRRGRDAWEGVILGDLGGDPRYQRGNWDGGKDRYEVMLIEDGLG